MSDLSSEVTEEVIAPDLSKLIDLGLLQLFGERTIVPINGTISTLALALAALEEEVEALDPDGNTSARLSSCEQNILALVLAFEIEQGAEVEGTSGNIVVETFADSSGFIIASGIFDSTNHRLYA